MKKNNATKYRPASKSIHKIIWRVFLALLIGIASNLPALAIQHQSDYTVVFTQSSKSKKEYRAGVLDKIISVDLKDVTLIKGLQTVAQKAGLKLVYSKEIVPVGKHITLQKDKIKVEDALWDLLDHTGLRFGVSTKRHLVLMKSNLSKKQEKEKQTGSIAGSVTDAKTGETLPGASVFIEGTTIGVSTDEKGHYILMDIDAGKYILISTYVGYRKQSRKISVIENDTTTVNFAMQPKQQALKEMVVTGYQTLSSERSSGAFSQVRASDIEARPSVDLSSALDGMFAGVRVQQEGAGRTKFTIRGLGTMTSSVEDPLIVVDGFAIEGGLSTVNPNDVKSINVLKDAAAASIWGARASNGVIVITTKKPQKGLNVDVNMFTGIQQKLNLDQANPIAGSTDALRWEKFLWENNQIFSSFSLSSDVDLNNNPVSFGVTLLNLRDQGKISQSEFDQHWNQLQQTDYKRDVNKYLLQNPVTQNFDIAISGGDERNDFVLNTRYADQQDDYRYDNQRQLLTDFRNNYKIAPWLDTHIGVTLKFTQNNNSGANLGEIKSMSPYENLVDNKGDYARMVGAHYTEFIDSTGQYFPKDWHYNLLQEARSRDLKSQENDIRIQTGLTFKLLQGLTYDTKFQYEQYKNETHNYYSEDSYYVRDQINKYVEYDQANHQVLKQYVPDGGQLLQNFGTTRGYTFRNQLNYNQEFGGGDHAITGDFITEISSKVTENYNAPTVYGYDPDRLSSAEPDTYYPIESYWGSKVYTLSGLQPVQSYLNNRFFSLAGNAAYTYKDKYSLTGSFRTDASNLIVKNGGDRYSPFWSVGGNWQLGKEDFIKNIDAINRLNIRLSYGSSGNVVTSTSPVPLISLDGIYPLTNVNYATIVNYGNPDLTWERTKTINFGVDYSLFNDKLFGSIEIYKKHGQDIVGQVDLPRVTGTSTQSFNTAEIINKGFELNINTSLPVTSGIFWNSTLNFSYNKSEVQHLSVLNYDYSTLESPHFEEGKPVNALYSYMFLGMNEDNVPYLQGIGDGTFTFNDIAPGTIDDREYMEYSGSTQPTTVIGFQNAVSAYGFRLSALIEGEFGNVFRRPTFDYNVLVGSKSSSTIQEDAVSVLNGTEKNIPGMPSGDAANLRNWSIYAPYLNSTIENASYVRLQEVNISYNLPVNLTARWGFRNAKVYFQIRNVGLLWVANDEGLDPTYNINGTTLAKPGRLYKLGVSFGF